MSDVIRLLPDSTANQIAAGEVIQRPASVIKELVENSIDAGAKAVTIILKDAGRTLIQVVDDGCGMSDTDARMAFERHATSKISRADDLFALTTMGFRGEALASIAAVAHVELRTMLRGASIGTHISIKGSTVESQEPEMCAQGSNMMVKNIFFNVPARRKFLKKDTVELGHILREFERLALVNVDVDFTLVSNDVTLHSLRRAPFKQRIADLFGKNLDKQLIPVETDTSLVRIQGYISLPEHARKRNQLQYLMVNGRNMRHPYFHKAILTCFEPLIPADSQPNYFIKFTVDPETIDVNIHPTKNEIKFENEQAIWQILTAAVRESLGRFNATPAFDFDSEEAPEIPAFSPSEPVNPELEPSYNPFRTQAPRPAAAGAAHRFDNWEKLYDDFINKRDESISAVESRINTTPPPAPDPTAPTLPALGEESMPATAFQLNDSYIATPSRGGLMIIDQHRAHVAILYEEYLRKAREHSFVCQRCMFPETVDLSPSQRAVLSAALPELSALGFELSSDDGSSEWRITGVPSVFSEGNPVEILQAILESIAENAGSPSDAMRERLALTLARAAAIGHGRVLTPAEMDRLIGDLFRLRTPAYTPDGLKVFTLTTSDDIKKAFQ